MKLRVVDVSHCESMPLMSVFHSGHWTQGYAELFGHDGVPTHLHVYNVEKARTAHREGKMVLPETVVTVSYAKEVKMN